MLQFTAPAPDLRVYNFDRRTSSLRVQGNWYVCSGINYTGECTEGRRRLQRQRQMERPHLLGTPVLAGGRPPIPRRRQHSGDW